MPPPVILNVLHSLVNEVQEQLQLAASVGHPGESGRAREEVIRRFLRRLVPAAFAIDTGFVIDSTGGISRQIDIVIYRTGYHPVFEIAGVKHFMVESVVAVIENKASIDSVERLRASLENVQSVKALDRTAGGLNHRIIGGVQADPVDRDDLNDQVFAAIVTEQSLAPHTLITQVIEFAKAHPRREWVNLYVDVYRYCGSYLTAQDKLLPHPMEARAVALSDPAHDLGQPPLLDFAFHLSNFLRVTEYIDYPPDEYFPFSRAAGHVMDLNL